MSQPILSTEDRAELLAALMLDYAHVQPNDKFSAKATNLFKLLAEAKGLVFSWREFEAALALLAKLGSAEIHEHPGVESHVLIIFTQKLRALVKVSHKAGSRDFDRYSFLYSYTELGASWLDEALDNLRVPDYPFAPDDIVVEGDGNLRLTVDDLTDETPVEELERAIAPASDRLVSLQDNQHETAQAIVALGEAEKAVIGSNSLEPDDREEIVASLSAGESLLKRGRKVAGKTLKTIIFDPLKKAWEKATEESLKTIFLAAMKALVALILAALK